MASSLGTLSGLAAAPQIASVPECDGCTVVTVAKNGGDFTDPIAAMAHIASQNPSASNRFLLTVAPGAYDLSAPLDMLEYVDIQGAGEGVTSLTRGGSDVHPLTGNASATVSGADNAVLRSLTVENTGGFKYATAILNVGASPTLSHVTFSTSGAEYLSTSVYNVAGSPIMNDVTAAAFGPSQDNFGLYNCDDAEPVMTNVTATAFGATRNNFGMHNNESSPTMYGSTFQGSGGEFNYGIFTDKSPALIAVDTSRIIGDTATIQSVDEGVTVRVTNSLLVGGPVAGDGTFTCLVSYNENDELLGQETCAVP